MVIEYCDQNGSSTFVKHGDIDAEGKCQVQHFRLRQTKDALKMSDHDKIVIALIRCGGQIDQMEFRTRDGFVYGPYGGMGGDQHLESAKDHGHCEYLSHVSGAVAMTKDCKRIVKLQLHWK